METYNIIQMLYELYGGNSAGASDTIRLECVFYLQVS